ncbi:accessory gene regulator ArgB-like protein [Clostridium ganghwense]|uniref:Accessory gene regulator B family protein n=1 Tax=Clostridium ganghwense TaxID=312089 RepID=A0ABT4CMK7_9CLOT|nr:accessory gene regulator B family protein [Clostridium ganghwense]MCY6370272.1 accessory gene regulator B family protein [Clostridium ganghwense]
MFLIENLSNKLSYKIASTLKLDNDNQEIIAYGVFSFLQTLWAILLIVLFGIIFDVLIEAVILSFTGSFLRKYSGGVHASSPNRCAVIGTIIFVGLGVIVNKISNFITFQWVVLGAILSFTFSYYTVYKLAPVDSPSKPIVKETKKQRLKRSSMLLLHSLMIIVLVLLGLYYKLRVKNLLIVALCMYIGTAWQSLTLTSKGHLLVKSIDSFLKNITTFLRGNNNEKTSKPSS